MSGSDIHRYYEDCAWSRFSETVSSLEELRIKETLSSIPEDSFTILEVGCGNGAITNRLSLRDCYVCGLDINQQALECVNVDKIVGNVGILPFKDKSFDLILCCEVLEHLPFQVYPEALKEIERVAKEYIVISVPFRQDLRLSSIRCPYCGCTFDTYRHIRSFNHELLRRLFVEFEPQITKPCGIYRSNPVFIDKVARFLFGTGFSTDAMCPQCGYYKERKAQVSSEISDSKGSPKHRVTGFINKCVPKKNNWKWIIASYRRR